MARTENITVRDAHSNTKVTSGSLRIGKTLYNVNVHFGKIPLEEILKNRIQNDVKRA